MALDSTVGGANSNSYNSVAEFDAYVTERGVDVGTPTTAQKEGWLIRATEYIESNWSGNWKGVVSSETQALAWPRNNAYDCEGRLIDDATIPNDIKKAVNELAIQAKDRADLWNYVQVAGVVEESSSVGSLSTSKKYSEGQVVKFPYSNVGKLLNCYLVGGFSLGSSRVVRV